jgi:hypothetical protein
MTIAFDGTGGLFTRLGTMARVSRNATSSMGTTATDVSAVWGTGGATVSPMGTLFTGIDAQFASSDQAVRDGIYASLTSVRGTISTTMAKMASLASSTIISMANNDVRLVRQDNVTALTEIINQMVANSETVQANTVSVTPTAKYTGTVTITGTPTGGTFTVTVDGATTSGVAFDASAGTLQTAVRALATVGSAGVTITGTAPYALTFLRQSAVSASGASLTGGTTPAATWADGVQNNTGNPTVLATVIGPEGVALENVFAETMELAVTNDSGLGATSGREPYQVRGEVAASGVTSWDYPLGSGASTTASILDPAIDNSDNMLTNAGGGWTFTTANTPDNWVIAVGTVGTTVLDGTAGTGYLAGTTKALKITGNGSQLTSLRQTFNSTTGTKATVKAQDVLAVNCRIKISATAAAGVLNISLVDGSGVVINDDAGTANTITRDLTTLTTTYVDFGGWFRLPNQLPSTVKVQVYLTTALENAKSVYIDDLIIARGKELYTRGPRIVAIRGLTPVVVDDQIDLVVANDMAGQFQIWADRWFDMRGLGIQLPSSGSPTISESLAT